MAQFNVSDEDVSVIREAMQSVLSDLRYEINNTDGADYRAKLRNNQAVLERFLAQLEES